MANGGRLASPRKDSKGRGGAGPEACLPFGGSLPNIVVPLQNTNMHLSPRSYNEIECARTMAAVEWIHYDLV
jgi:hypothetical protein